MKVNRPIKVQPNKELIVLRNEYKPLFNNRDTITSKGAEQYTHHVLFSPYYNIVYDRTDKREEVIDINGRKIQGVIFEYSHIERNEARQSYTT